jgi:Dolichyl-phosphate-mannose-protein mannosyltransferase
MYDRIVLAWVGLIFFAAAFFASISFFQLFRQKKIAFDKGFLFSLSACAVSLLLCLSVWPWFHHVYQDEFSYISQSVNILSSFNAGITTKGTLVVPEAVSSWTANPKLPGYAWLEAVILFFTRDFYQSYFILNLILGTLMVGILYRIVWLLTASQETAWWSAIFLACLPVRITYSMSGASDIPGAFFFFLFILFICEYKRSKTRRVLYAALFCGIYSICIKPFYGIFVIGGLIATLNTYRREGVLDRRSFYQALLDSFCLFLPILVAVPVFLFSDLDKGGYSISFVMNNIYASLAYLFDGRQNTSLTAYAALFAVVRNIFYQKDKSVYGLAGWFLTGILMVSVFYAGGISEFSQAYSERYLLFFVFPFAFLAGKGMVGLAGSGWSRLLLGFFLIALVANAYTASHKYAVRSHQHGFYKKALLLKKMGRLIPDNAYVIDECAAFVAIETSMKPIQTTLFLDGDHPQDVVFLKGISDFAYPYRTTMVENILKTAYRCKPLAAAPFKEEELSATPLLCARK